MAKKKTLIFIKESQKMKKQKNYIQLITLIVSLISLLLSVLSLASLFIYKIYIQKQQLHQVILKRYYWIGSNA